MPAAKKKAAPRKKKTAAAASSRGISAADVISGEPSGAARDLADQIEADSGRALAIYRDPLGGVWQVLASLPIDRVSPTPFQRDLSDTHVKRLTGVLERLDRFLDPIVAVRGADGGYWTPNGNHRLAAMKRLGAKSIIALVLPEQDVAFQILALNTEKAHNVKEKSVEVIRMARVLAERGDEPETKYAAEFEEAPFLTLGLCYEENARFSGGAYQSVLRRVDRFLDAPLSEALETRSERAKKLLTLDEAVAAAAKKLKEAGFESPYLKPYVIARINPLRFQKGGGEADFDEIIEKMTASAQKFDAKKVKSADLEIAATAAAAGGGDDDGESED